MFLAVSLSLLFVHHYKLEFHLETVFKSKAGNPRTVVSHFNESSRGNLFFLVQ